MDLYDWRSSGLISICIAIKNRIQNLTDYVIPSVNAMDGKDVIELSVYDLGSKDFLEIEGRIRETWKGALVLGYEEHAFSRSYGLNKAAEQAKQDRIFLCDADITLPKTFVADFRRLVEPNQVWFPICFGLGEGKPKIVDDANGFWIDSGYGMMGVYRSDFFRVGAYDTRFKWWGAEDEEIWKRFVYNKFLIRRGRYIGMFHNWHVQDNTDNWHSGRNTFYCNTYPETELYKKGK
jgi:hypothetical protein